ncbi:MAG: HPr family phosphocarrier protein [Lachnospiraceae bacterium]|jgi:phosphocarrier protein HPr|nr:HPr family phosphocarrier protein [Lachnospiraceae bacterium]MCI1727405.1 HPr family phosphocarrier protein [Lachnospiraceae bacterium]
MSEYKVKLSEKDVKDFVNAAEKHEGDVDISYNHYIIDAKSILGILSMDLSRVLTVAFMGRDPQFEKAIRKYTAA